MKNLPRVLLYAALQGIFMPLILWVNDLRERGGAAFLSVFLVYEALVIGDTLLYWLVFKAEK